MLGALLIGVVALLWSPLPGSPTAQAAPSVTSKAGAGTVLGSTDITDEKDARMTGARQVIAMTYLSENAQGTLIPVRATVSIPEKNPHGGDYRIFAWAHGTAGLGDGCTVTDRMGVRVDGKERWHDWMGPCSTTATSSPPPSTRVSADRACIPTPTERCRART